MPCGNQQRTQTILKVSSTENPQSTYTSVAARPFHGHLVCISPTISVVSHILPGRSTPARKSLLPLSLSLLPVLFQTLPARKSPINGEGGDRDELFALVVWILGQMRWRRWRQRGRERGVAAICLGLELETLWIFDLSRFQGEMGRMWNLALSAASNLRQVRRFSAAIPGPYIVHKRGTDILHDPWFNKVGSPLFSYCLFVGFCLMFYEFLELHRDMWV